MALDAHALQSQRYSIHKTSKASQHKTTCAFTGPRKTAPSVDSSASHTIIATNMLARRKLPIPLKLAYYHPLARAVRPAAVAPSSVDNGFQQLPGTRRRSPFSSATASSFRRSRGVETVSGAVTAPSSASTAPTTSRELPTYQHRVWSPLSSATDAAPPGAVSNDALLVIAPGAYLTADDFQPLVAALQTSAPNTRLWVTAINLDPADLLAKLCRSNGSFQDLGPAMDAVDGYYQLLNQAVEQATERGFVPQREGGGNGRIANMVMLCQSTGALMAPLAARTAAATILLACTPNAEEYSQQRIIGLEAWPRPLMMLTGELDGQMRWPWLSPYIVESAVLATKLGPRLAAITKPVVVLPRVNHANTSNGQARTARGDITAGVAQYDTCIQMLAGCIAPFLTAHTSPSETDREQAATALLAAVRKTAHLTAPYCRAAGLGDPAAPHTTRPHDRPLMSYEGDGIGDDAGPLSRVGRLVAGAQRMAGSAKSSALCPGAVVAAESAAVAAQSAVLRALPSGDRERLRVVATAHMDVDTFLYSHPEVEPLPGGRWLLHVHVLVHFRSLDGPGLSMASAAPDYTLKLRNAAFVAAMLGLPQPSQYPTPSPAALHTLTLAAALAAVPPAVAERYRRLGRTLQFEDDIDMLAPGPDGTLPRSPEVFVRQSRIKFTYPLQHSEDGAAPAGAPSPFASSPPPPPGPVRVSSPYLVVLPPDDVASRSRTEARFTGVFYTKLMSLAQVVEWVSLDSLREGVSPW